ncbi:tRNA (adenosine(37)-N6)-threonylcarbamoyltransferase complex ATPase subunit type 1 TsaE [candidate division WWE3 bacterium RIFOXYD1_FULL_39_9]|uniref:tRNA threonylcarbamoyladenosine biosynthesis protein TsaE n=1 Tax=candidate division WWE3 bacterium RIFOXYD1_FULL_39_9 TaxID=1802649 RepID=A0A1F4X9M3_UNCKA|nr:MAG: tRNA (adenosine(37)-N6)-threonylcarbamoyltransferase complex ATPase subunit type 1 TsaE [candidate division WWE3 bacterium RIFOXYD1_FULL_39_9]
MEVTTNSTEETKELATKLAKNIKPGMVLALYGDLGSGKTTFTRFLVEALGFTSKVQSPTFVIARRYTHDDGSGKTEIKEIRHLDFYRLQSKQELEVLDMEYFFDDKDVLTIVEWPEIAEEQLPADTIKLKFSYVDENSRKIYVQNLH